MPRLRIGGNGDAPISGAMETDAADLILIGAAAGDLFSAQFVGDVNGDELNFRGLKPAEI